MKIKGADGAKGENKMHEGENKMRKGRNRGIRRINKRHKSEGGKPKGKREKRGADRAKDEKCMRGEINCERENKGLRGKKKHKN